MNPGEYKKASTYYLIGNVFNKGIAFLTVPVFTRILSTTDYGIVTTYNSWIGILAMIMGFALHMGIRMAFVDYKDEINNFMSSVVLFTLISSFGLVLIVSLITILLQIDINILLIILCMLHAVSTALIEDYTQCLMMQYRYKSRTALMLLPNLISVVLSIVAILFVFESDKYFGRIIPTALVNVIFGLILTVLIVKKGKFAINFKHIKYGFSISAPLIVHGIALNVLSQSDRTMITWLSDASQTGIYSLIYNFSMIATVITTTLEGVWIPWFTNKMEKGERQEINKLSVDYINLMTYAMGCLILVAPEIVKLLADKSYWEGITIVPPVVLSNFVIFSYSLYVNVEHYHKKTIYITINTLIAATINIVLNYILIPQYGYVAAAYTTLVAYLVSFVLHSNYAKKLQCDLYPLKNFIRPIIHLVVLTAVYYFLIDCAIIRWIIMFIYFAMMLVKEHKRIFEFFPEVENKLFKKDV